MTQFTSLPILPSDGIPRAAIEARQEAFDQLWSLCRDVYRAGRDDDELVQEAIEQLPAVLKAIRKPLLPKQNRKPRLRVRKAGVA